MGSTFVQIEGQLRALDRRGATVRAWKAESPVLSASPIRWASEVPGFVWSLDSDEADDVMRVLVGRAQDGDEAAVLVVLACLRPGLARLAGRLAVPIDEAVSQAATRIMTVRLDGRDRVASGLVLDVFRELLRDKRREDLEEFIDPAQLPAYEPMARDQGVVTSETDESSAEELEECVLDAFRAGRLSRHEASLIIETRVWGHTIEEVARRRSVSRWVIYGRRRKAEQRLISWLKSPDR